MIEVRIPKELDHYEAKVIGPFTLRQMVCLVCALPLGVLLFNFTKGYFGMETAGFFCLIPGGIAFLFGWTKPYGMKFEVFLRSVLISTVLAPSKRKYKTMNYYKLLMSKNYEEDDDDDFFIEEENKKSRKKKKDSSGEITGYLPSSKAIF